MKKAFFSRSSIAAIAAILVFSVAFYCVDARFRQSAPAAVRTVSLQKDGIDYRAFLDGFDDAGLEIANHSAAFSASVVFDAGLFEGIDRLSSEEGGETYTMRFSVVYDYEAELVRLSAVMDTPDGEVVLDTVCGKVFFDGDIVDALLDFDGELMTLKELTEISAINEVGLFSNLVKAAQAVVTTAAVAVQAVVTQVVTTVATVAVAVIKTISEQINDLVDAVAAKISGKALSAEDIAIAFSIAKLERDHRELLPYVFGNADTRTKLNEFIEYLKTLPQAGAEMKKAINDDSLPILYKIVAVVVKSGALELVSGVVSGIIPLDKRLAIAAINYAHNSNLNEADVLHYENGLIEYQNICEKWKAGLNNLKWSGCGYIAAYNYMKAAGKYMTLANVIFEFDINNTQNIGSVFGINPYEYPIFFNAHGISYVRYDSVEALQAAANAKGDCRIILSYVWVIDGMDSISAIDKAVIKYGVPLNAHFVTVEKVNKNSYNAHIVHNINGFGTYASIQDFFDNAGTYTIIINGFILP
jgi:hypothetical protein